MAVVKNLMIRAGADFSSMRKEMSKANKNLSDFKSGVSRTMKGIGVALATLGIGAAIRGAAKEAMGFEASMGQIQRTMGGNAQAFTKWASSGAKAFNLSKAEAIKFGAVYSNLVSGFAKDTATTTKYTEDLLKSSGVIASATGRDITDVMDRIRSGMLGSTEAIEDLGINVNIAMIESTDAFKKFAGGKSWAKLNFQTQQQIRLFAILEQSTKKYGTALADNTTTAQGRFLLQLKDARLALGQAFLPIYNVVLPALTRMATALANVMNLVAQFSQALFGKPKEQVKATTAQATAVEGLGDAYTSAGKAAQKSVAGFDQLNLIGGTDGAGAAGDAGTAGAGLVDVIPTDEIGPDTESVSAKIKKMAADMRAAFKDMVSISGESKLKLKDSLDGLKESFKGLSEAIKDLSDTIMSSPVIKKFFEDFKNEKSIQLAAGIDAVSGAMRAWGGTFTFIDGVLSGDFSKMKEGAAENIRGTWQAIKGVFTLMFPDLSKKIGEWKDGVIKKWGELKTGTSTKFSEIKTTISGKWTEIKNIDWGAVKDILVGKWSTLKTDTGTKFSELKTMLSTKWAEIKALDWATVKNTINTKWDELKTSTGAKFTELKKVISDKWKMITDLDFTGVKTGIVGIWNGLKTETSTIWTGIKGVIKSSINSIIEMVNKVIRGLNKFSIDIPDWIAKIAGIKGGKFGINIGEITPLAKGGLAFGPTLAMVGDNKGAASNPEVIAPLDKLESMMSGDDNREVVSVLKAILQAVKTSGNSDTATINKTALGRAASSALNDLTRRSGRNPLTV